MATRGTYKIDGKLLYNHWDNYPEGAAMHLHGIITKQNAVDFLSCVRGLESFDLSNSIYDGRAEYHYIIDSASGLIEVYTIPFEVDTIILKGKYKIEDFINTYIEKSAKEHEKRGYQFFNEGETLENTKIVKVSTNEYYTVAQIEKKVFQTFEKAKAEFAKNWIGNSSSSFGEAFKLMNKAGLKFQNLIDEYLKDYCDKFAKSYNHETNEYFANKINN